VTHVLDPFEDITDRRAVPAIGVCKNIVLFIPHAFLREVIRGAGYTLRFEDGGDLRWAFPLNRHAKNPAHNVSGVGIDKPLVFVLGAFDVAIQRVACGVLAVHAFGFVYRLDFPAGIAGVPFRKNIAKRHEIVLAVQCIDIIADGDQADVFLSERFHKKPDP
jgi:hypothetical protein